MLYSLAIELRARKTAVPEPALGYQCYSMVLKCLRASHPKLSERIHSGQDLKPVTVSSLLTVNGTTGTQPRTINAGILYAVRITCLTDEVFTAFMDGVARLGSGCTITIGNIPFTLERIATSPLQSPLCAFTSFEQLFHEADSQHQVRLCFLSPTAFRSRGIRNVVRPDARLVFGSYLTRWNTFSPIKIDQQWLDWCTSQVAVSDDRLLTRLVNFGSYQEAGFTGRCIFEASPEAPVEMLRTFNALADFAWFAGTGAKTTMGMGQTRRQRNAGPLSGRTGRHSS